MSVNEVASEGNKDFHKAVFDVIKGQRLIDGITHEKGMSPKDIVRQLEATSSWLDEKRNIKEDSKAKFIIRTCEEMSLQYPEDPLIVHEGRPKRFKAVKGFEFPTESIDSPTALTLLMAKDLLHHSLPSVCHKQLDQHLGDIEDYLKKNKSEYLNWKEKVAWYPEGYSNHMGDINDIRLEVFDSISKALFHDKKIEATYIPRYCDEIKTSQINPLGLVNRGSIVYLVATYWNYDKIVHLPLYRFSNVKVLEQEAHKPKSFNFKSYIEQDGLLKKDNDGVAVLVQLKVPAYLLEHFQERQPGIKETFTSDEETGIVEFQQVVTNEFKWWLRALGANIKVLAPEPLITEIKSDLEKTLAQYS